MLNTTTRILIGTTSDTGNFGSDVNDECRSQTDSIQNNALLVSSGFQGHARLATFAMAGQ